MWYKLEIAEPGKEVETVAKIYATLMIQKFYRHLQKKREEEFQKSQQQPLVVGYKYFYFEFGEGNSVFVFWKNLIPGKTAIYQFLMYFTATISLLRRGWEYRTNWADR